MNNLEDYLSGAGENLYRDYISYLLKRLSFEKIVSAGAQELENVEQYCVVQGSALNEILDDVKKKFFGHLAVNSPNIWNTLSCRQAVDLLRGYISESNLIDEKKVEDIDIQSNVLYTFYLVFSYLAAVDAYQSKSVRRAMGIRKGLFG